MQNPTQLFRYRIIYQKLDALRYTGHLDLHRAWERTLRRANLPIAYSQGFHPQPRMQQACALPLGFTSLEEVIDVWLESEISLETLLETLESTVPPGIIVLRVSAADLRLPPLQTQVCCAEYTIELLETYPAIELKGRIDALLAQASLPRERRGKTYDLRPLIEDLEVQSAGDEREACGLHVRLAAREGSTGRPEEVLSALELDPQNARVQRIRLIFSE